MSSDKDIDKVISIPFTMSNIKAMFIEKTGIDGPLADLIMGHINHSPVGLEQITKGLLGIFPTAKYSKGEFVYVPVQKLPSWRINREETLKLASCVDSFIMAQITHVDIYDSSPYKIAYTAVLTDGKIAETEYSVIEETISHPAENPEEILEIIENLTKPLPF